MNFRAILFASLFLVSQSVFASLLTLVPGTSNIKGVNIATSATGTVEGRALNLAHTSAGLRIYVTGGVIKTPIYVAQLLVSDYQKYCTSVTTDALASVTAVPAKALISSFVYPVPQTKLVANFQESFSKNNVDMTVPAVKEFLDQVAAGGDVVTGQSFTIIGETLTDGTDVITYETPSGVLGKSIHAPAGFVKSVFSIWFGVPADKQLGDLKNDLSTCGVN